MDKSNLTPYLRKNLDILFVGLNPAKGSSENRHYFSVNSSFWNQIAEAGLITEWINKATADTIVFGSNEINMNKWNYGITDLITEIAESNSSKVKPTVRDNLRLEETIRTYEPKVVILLHSKVNNSFLPYLGYYSYYSNQGYLGKIMNGSETIFYTIAFPHGNAIKSEDKIKHYKSIKENLLKS